LHLSILEQISIDQPIGIKRSYQVLQQKLTDTHLAQHALMECLAETIWQAQRSQTAPDSQAYLALINERAASH